ncbi:hypothetical protein ACFV4M_01995 [Kitasatospora indigofera]|uniref:hypothetical protein n=1 Tax=Kitasatospora indigofera TaxID=67307 RepID=UPI0036577BC1
MDSTARPAGDIARHTTAAGATIALATTDRGTSVICGGCESEWVLPEQAARDRAQAHAKTCRTLPKP